MLAVAIGIGCQPAPPGAPAATPRPEVAPAAPSGAETSAPSFDVTRFRTAISESLEAYLVARPTVATQRGEHRFDDAWPDLSEAGAKRVADDFRARAQGLRTIAASVPETTSLAAAETDRPRLDALVLADALEADAYETTVVRGIERNPSSVLVTIGSGVNGLVAHPYAPQHDRYNALDARLQRIPALLQVARGRLKVPTQSATENAAIVGSGLAKLLRDEYTNVDVKAIDGDAALEVRLKKDATAAAAAIDAYLADVTKSFPPKTLKNEPIGAEAWATLARLRDGVTESPLEVRKMGEAELARLFAELEDLYQKNKQPNETLAQFVDRLGKDTPKPDRVLDEYRAANKGVEKWLRGHPFVSVPWDKVKLEIVATPPHQRGVSFASMNAAGALDSIADARFEVNAPDGSTPKDKRDALLRFHANGAREIVSIHEALPGHYLQYLHARELPSKVRRVFWSATTGEGWAHYCEKAVIDEGYALPDPVRARFFYLTMALQRAARVVIDVGVNDGSLSVEQAAELVQKNAFLAPGAAQIEARRAVVAPANMYTYTYGKLAILRLREGVKAREKEKFELARFHDRLLSVGAVPVRYLGPAAFGTGEGGT
jgi:uncharacterized protein (DUF885 family)